jgi:hypothetical protein
MGLGGCSSRSTDTGTETHWLLSCDKDSECGGGTSCLCGVCTVTCVTNDGCPAAAPVCATPSADRCSSGPIEAVCLDLQSTPASSDPSNSDPSNSDPSNSDPGDSAPGPGDEVELLPPNLELGTKAISSASNCDDAGWCWYSGAPEDHFTAISPDGKYAVGRSGVVFDTSGVYLERPTALQLDSVVTHENDVWVADGTRVWRKRANGREEETSAGVFKLAVGEDGTLWGISHDGNLMRRDNGEWSAVELPRTTTSEGARFLDDLTTHGDGRVWVSGQYLNGRIGDGTVWVLEEDGWREYPSNKRTGSPRFLAGANAPYVYALPEDRSDGVVVYAPKRGWATVAASSEPAVKLLFWSPDGQLWKSTEQGLARFDDESATSSGSAPLGNKTGCTVTVAWDNQTVLCSRLSGGLSYLTPGEGGLLVERQPIPEREALDPKAFGESPTPVWAQDATAWAASVNDVWKMPLDHYDGATWASFLESDDDFEPFRLSGTGSSDVWFLSESQLRHWDGAEVSLVSLPPPKRHPTKVTNSFASSRFERSRSRTCG